MLFTIFILVVVFFLSLSYFNRKTVKKLNYTPIEYHDLTKEENEFLRLINEHRINLGLNPLIPEMLACEVCDERILKDIENNVLSSHLDWESLITDSKAKEGSHIVANNFSTPYSLFNGYISSEKHKKAIENKDRTHIGTRYYFRRNHTILLKY